MSEKEERSSFIKLLVAAIITVFITNAGSAIFNAKTIQSDTKRNTESIYDLSTNQKRFVDKSDNEKQHDKIYNKIENIESKRTIDNREIIKQIDQNQRFILERIDNVNNNILKLHNVK